MKKILLFVSLSISAFAGDYRILLGNDIYLIEFNSNDRKIIDVPRHFTVIDTDITFIGKTSDYVYGVRTKDTDEKWFILNLTTKTATEFSSAKRFILELKKTGLDNEICLQLPIHFAKHLRADRIKEIPQ
jgi:hypothetical protein